MTKQPAGPPDKADETAETAAKSAAEAPPPRTQIRARSRADFQRRTWRRGVDAIATAVTLAAVIVAVILALHIVFVVFEANAANGIVTTINDWAGSLAWKFKDVFTPADPKAAALINYGLAAVLYLVVGRFVAGLIRRAF
jgi:hypothetical protein